PPVPAGPHPRTPPEPPPPPPRPRDPAGGATSAPPATEKKTAVNEGGTPEVTTGQRAATPRKVRKASASHTHSDRVISSRRDERWRGDVWSARAYAQPNYGNSRYQYARSWSGGSW